MAQQAAPDEQPDEVRAEADDEAPAMRRSRRRRRPSDEDGERTVAFGDHTPDFLLRPVPVTKSKSASSSQAVA